ncbi:hypothetical protein [Streptomyces sp. CC224B]|uniref:hypothetical protein n=1 Tax=Streptomyces sp. CC224B TaxID=3044571 RepID=UPI0024A7CE82|nr:hypothetical protein [Streptomyces sp. CC224B]
MALSAVVDHVTVPAWTALVARGGTVGLGAARIALEVHLIVFVLVSGLAGGALVLLGLLGLLDGAADASRTREVRRLLGRAHGVLGLLLGALVTVVPGTARVFTSDPAVARAAGPLLLLLGAACPILAVAHYWIVRARVLLLTRAEMAINTICSVAVLLPGALCGRAVAGLPGAFAAFVAYWAARLLLTALAVRRHEGAAVPVGAGT